MSRGWNLTEVMIKNYIEHLTALSGSSGRSDGRAIDLLCIHGRHTEKQVAIDAADFVLSGIVLCVAQCR